MWNPFKRKVKPSGVAILKRYPATGLKYWTTMGAKGADPIDLSHLQPLVFPVEKLAVGTRVEIYLGDGK